ncbi:MAG: hypothetical protein HS116_16545 [Planctomycetes bacterium]|nr:hypothetical protein [Planctomycetota bacterium]
MKSVIGNPGLVVLLAAVVFCAQGTRAAELQAGMPLGDALRTLQASGLKLVYSDALVSPDLKLAAAPKAGSARAQLEEVLAPLGLRAKAGPGESIVVVKGPETAAPGGPGIVSNVFVLSDKVKDISSIEAWKKSYLKDGLSEKERALIAWESCFTYQHQETPPDEFLGVASQMDPIKIFNVYGYAMCNSASSNVEALSRASGLKARGRIINSHSVPEVEIDGHWSLLDGSLICYFPQPDGKFASVDELIAGVRGWLKENPALQGNNDALYKFMKEKGWKNGPEILRGCQQYDERGWFPAATHGWYSTMQEYDVEPNQIYEYGTAMGYRVNIQLRHGEKLIRNWSNKGLHVNRKFGGGTPGCLTQKIGADNLRYSPKQGDLAPGRIGNGEHIYSVPLASGAFRGGALKAENLQAKSEGAQGAEVLVKDAAQPAELIIPVNTSYVFLQSHVRFDAVVGNGGSISVSYSDTHGIEWKELGNITQSGSQDLDLSDALLRRYQYRVRFVLKGAGTGLSALVLHHDVQHSQRPLPALDTGENTITFRSGPQEGTLTIEPNLSAQESKKHSVLHYSAFKPEIKNLRDGPLFIEGGEGSLTQTIETPGELKRIRLGTHFRARDKNDGWDVSISYDGENFEKIHRMPGPTAATSEYFAYEGVKAGQKKCWIRYSGTNRNATGLLHYRIDADYAEPQGGFAPIKVTYVWEENGQEKKHEHIAKSESETYTIKCEAKPLMKSITLERAP